jgi:uncharacterized protein
MLSKLTNIQRQFTKSIRTPQNGISLVNVDVKRMHIYQTLLFNNVNEIVSACFPVLVSIIPCKKWNDFICDFISHHPCKTPLFHQLPKEFIAYLKANSCDKEYPFLIELAHYEWAELALELSQEDLSAINVDDKVDLLDGKLVISPLAWLLEYNFDVQNIGVQYQPKTHCKTYLIVYRDKKNDVYFMKINALTHHLMTLLKRHTPRDAFAMIASKEPSLTRDDIYKGGVSILARMLSEEIIFAIR